jgi:hypothetical protein
LGVSLLYMNMRTCQEEMTPVRSIPASWRRRHLTYLYISRYMSPQELRQTDAWLFAQKKSPYF